MRRSFEAILCVFIAPLALLFLSTASRAEDLLVKNGETKPLSGDQTFDVVTVEAGGILVLNGQMKITCSRFSFAGKLIISGDTVIEMTYGRDHPDSNEWAMRIAPNQVLYPFDPMISVDYPPIADDGGTEGSGAAGSPGVDGYRLTMTVHGHMVFEGTEKRPTKFYIDLNGQSGGSGITEAGGRSGNAGQGGKGGVLNLAVLGNIVVPSYVALDWSVNGGRGGEYGGPDDPSSYPGGGGNLGQGGAGGTIQLRARSIDPNLYYATLQANGGGGGSEAGDAYGGDEPGLSAPGGPGGQITVRTDGDFVPSARWSFYANGGAGGMCGDCFGSQCYWWTANCACHEIQNWTGQGGKGGRITVEARDINNLYFYSQGGNGGNGHSAHNMVCQYDGDSCLWGSNNGVRIGNGGDGASAGNGGLVSVISRTRSVGDGVSYVLNGGTGGTGGHGGGPSCTGGVQICCTDNICPSGVDGADGADGSPGSFTTKRQGGSLIVLPMILEKK